jgi:hypothetical protein
VGKSQSREGVTGTAGWFVSPGEEWRGVKVERHSETRSIRSSQIGDEQAAAGQFVFLSRGEGMFRTKQTGVTSFTHREQRRKQAARGVPVQMRDSGILYSSVEVKGILKKMQSRRPMFVSMSLQAISTSQLE